MTSIPTISILMPVYNASERLGRALAGIRQQDYAEWELVAVDDGSTDGSPEMLRQAAREDARVRPFLRPHAGIAAALNAGAREARGEWIARMDSDDLMRPDRLRVQLEFARSRPELALTGSLVRLEAEQPLPEESGMVRFINWVNSQQTPEEIHREILVDCPIPHPTFFLRRQTLLNAGLYAETDEPEDYSLVLRLDAAGRRMGKVPEELVVWTDRPDRASRSLPQYAPERFREMKARHLRQGVLADGRRFLLWGAGRVGKHLLRELQRQGMSPAAVVDVDPRKIGQVVHGCPVIAPEAIPSIRAGTWPIVCAVGAPGAREDIRRGLNAMGLREGTDYIFAA